jgi:serine protease Do
LFSASTGVGPDRSVRELVNQLGEAVVQVRAPSGLGSGFFINDEGYLITNFHVIEGETQISVEVYHQTNGQLERKTYKQVKILAMNKFQDLALLKIEDPGASGFAAVVLGATDALAVGERVFAIGSPLGLERTVTEGIVSTKTRHLQGELFLQTSAQINPGNSGGPLFNMNGEIVGINTAIVAQGQGIGFAIPINVAKDLLPQLKTGKIIRGWMGVMIQDITPELAESFNIKETKGVLIADVVQDGPADKAGLQRGDVVTKFNGKEIDNVQALTRLVAQMQPDAKANVEILRDGKSSKVQVAVGTMPEGTGEPGAKKPGAWGLTVQNLTPELAERFGWSKGETGVVISAVEPGSPAAEARLRQGDVIQEVNRRKVKNLRDYNLALESTKKEASLLLLIKRGDHTFWVTLKPARE